MTWIGPPNHEQVAVPDLVGLTIAQAYEIANRLDLVLATSDPDGPPLIALTWRRDGLVTAQSPAPGEMMRVLGSLRIDYRLHGGQAGDRQPRRPPPNPQQLTGRIDPATDSA